MVEHGAPGFDGLIGGYRMNYARLLGQAVVRDPHQPVDDGMAFTQRGTCWGIPCGGHETAN